MFSQKEYIKKYKSNYYQKNINSILKNVKEWQKNNPEEVRIYKKRWIKNNLEKAKEKSKLWREINLGYNKKYYQENKEIILERSKNKRKENPEYIEKWRIENYDHIKKYQKKWESKNKDKISKHNKRYREKNKLRIKKYLREWYLKNKIKLIEEREQWIKNNPEKAKQIAIQDNKEREDKYLKTILTHRISKDIHRALIKGSKKGRHWEDLVGYKLENLIKRLEYTMPKKYTWDDYINGKLHIDHIIPVSVFNFTKPEHIDFKRCWALSNLQLLPAKENRIKHNKLFKLFQPALKI